MPGTAEYTDCISEEGCDSPNESRGYDTKQSDGKAGALENAEYPFIVIAPMFTLARSVVALDRVLSRCHKKLNCDLS